MVAGDFNALLEQQDKLVGRPVASASTGGLRGVIDTNGLLDLGFCGYAYTWNNRRSGKANIQEQLDRGFSNGEWKARFPTAVVTHLTAHHSDHRPILINLYPPTSSRPRPFRFEEMWTRDESAALVIQHTWNKGRPLPYFSHLMTKLKMKKVALKEWNVRIFGHLQSKIRQLKSVIESLQACPSSAGNFQMEQQAQADLDELLLRERILWKEKAKARGRGR